MKNARIVARASWLNSFQHSRLCWPKPLPARRLNVPEIQAPAEFANKSLKTPPVYLNL